MKDMNQTPSANRLHISVFGARNAGKSSLINALCGREAAIVSSTPGTTTDPVKCAMELAPFGACVITDTAGFDDPGELGEKRVEKSRLVLEGTDVAIILCRDAAASREREWAAELKLRGIPFIAAVSQADRQPNPYALQEQLREMLGCEAVITSAHTREGIEELKRALCGILPEDFGESSIVGHIAKPGDTVMLVMPQDKQAPKGRLILPQAQTLRELIDLGCTSVCVKPEGMESALKSLAKPPELIICDSQVFPAVYEKKPSQSRLTSFSVLFARHKGDIDEFLAGAAAIDRLKPGDRVLIAEACAHDPKDGDIGRVKIPALLRKKVGELHIDTVAGPDFSKRDLSRYNLIIHCGACMYNRRLVLSRVQAAKAAGVPITNYGITIAKLSGILDKIDK